MLLFHSNSYCTSRSLTLKGKSWQLLCSHFEYEEDPSARAVWHFDSRREKIHVKVQSQVCLLASVLTRNKCVLACVPKPLTRGVVGAHVLSDGLLQTELELS